MALPRHLSGFLFVLLLGGASAVVSSPTIAKAATSLKEAEERRHLTTSAVELPISCDFDSDDWCGWSYDVGAYAWELGSGGTATLGTGPGGDHTSTSGSGFYALIEASDDTDASRRLASGDCPDTCAGTDASCDYVISISALTCERLESEYGCDCGGCYCSNSYTYNRGPRTLKSPELSGGSDGALIEFWHHMHGADMGTLKVDTFDGTAWTTQWSETGDQGNEWTFASVVAGTEVIRARFIGTTGDTEYSDMAVDDIMISGGMSSLPSVSPVPTPNPTVSSEPTPSPTPSPTTAAPSR